MWSLLLILLIAEGADSPTFVAETLDGQSITGAVVVWDSQSVTLQQPDAALKLDREQLLVLRQLDADSPDEESWLPQIHLIDGSRLAGVLAVSEEAAQLTLPIGETVRFSSRQIADVVFQEPTAAHQEQWAQIRRVNAASDLLVLRKRGALDYIEGIVRGISPEAVQFEIDGETIDVARTKVAGVLFFHNQKPKIAAPACIVHTRPGQRLYAKTTLFSGEKLSVETTGGVTIDVLLRNVVRADYAGDKIRFLSDLTPISAKWTPFFQSSPAIETLQAFFEFRGDQALGGGPLTLAGTGYPKGIALRSRTELVYEVPVDFRRLRATVGIDDAVRPAGSVRLVIRGDDRVVFDEVISGRDAPRTLDCDVAGVRRLTILADYGPAQDVADHLDLASARITK